MTDRMGLASHLGVERLTYDPVRIRPGLYAASVDRSQALDEYLGLQLSLARSLPTRQLSNALSVLADTAPGIREIVTMGKPVFEVWREEWDLVIADAPPLGQLQSYLAAPETITGLVPTGAVREQASRLEATLSDPTISGLLLVTIPEELAVQETREAIAHIDRDPAGVDCRCRRKPGAGPTRSPEGVDRGRARRTSPRSRNAPLRTRRGAVGLARVAAGRSSPAVPLRIPHTRRSRGAPRRDLRVVRMTHATRTFIITGAGGVGKTTISAATAIRLAGPECRTVVMTVDPARRLADALDLHTLSNEPTPVPGVTGLWASTLDASASWEGVVHRYSAPEVANGFSRTTTSGRSPIGSLRRRHSPRPRRCRR